MGIDSFEVLKMKRNRQVRNFRFAKNRVIKFSFRFENPERISGAKFFYFQEGISCALSWIRAKQPLFLRMLCIPRILKKEKQRLGNYHVILDLKFQN